MNLSPERVRLIRTSGWPDTHWARLWRVSRNAVRRARIGTTWADHPTLPDKAHRGFKRGGRPRQPSTSSGGLHD